MDVKTYLEEILARCEAATPGVWQYVRESWSIRYLKDGNGYHFGQIDDDQNGDFIAHARTDLPLLARACLALIEMVPHKYWCGLKLVSARKKVSVCQVCGERAGPGGCHGETKEEWFDVLPACDAMFMEDIKCTRPRGHSGQCWSSNPQHPPTESGVGCTCGRDQRILDCFDLGEDVK